MINRERKEGESRSGGVLALIDQIATGFSSGTFDIEISDQATEDLAAFAQAYPQFKPDGVDRVLLQKPSAQAKP